MIRYIKSKIAASLAHIGNAPQNENIQDTKLTSDLTDNMVEIRRLFDNSSDFLTREIEIKGIKVSFLMIEGMINIQTMSEILLEPLLNKDFGEKPTAQKIYNFIETKSVLAVDMKDIYSTGEVFQFIMSGFVIILIDGMAKGITFGMQGFNFRSITEPTSEMNELGSHEGFTEPLRINMTMVRRRVKSPTLKFELFSIGNESKTDICMMYMTNKVSDKLLQNVRNRLKNINLDIVLTSGYIEPFLEGRPWSPFSDVGKTERPDVVAGKIFEGRIAILIDGTPYALLVPYLFNENFQSIDDYAHRSFFATFLRIIKYISFFAAIFLPAIYVAVGTFHPELLPQALLFNVVIAEETTPFPLMIEAILIHFLYEIMREAGLRLPRPVGHVVGIVGALVIGDAAVSAGLIGAPMILMIALTAIASFVVPSLYPPISILRLIFVIIGGTTGLYGIVLGGLFVLIDICSLNNFGMPYMAPFSPFSMVMFRDTIARISFTKLNKSNTKVQNINGTEIENYEEND